MKKEIIAPDITINEFKVESLNLEKKSMTVSFGYTAKLESFTSKAKLNKVFDYRESSINFIFDTLIEIKQLSGTEKAKIDREAEIKEKLTNMLARLVREIKNLGKIKEYEHYMKAFNRIHCYKTTFE